MHLPNFIAKLVPVRARMIAAKVFRGTPPSAAQPAPFKDFIDALSCLECRVSYNKYGGYCVPESSQHRPAARLVLDNDVYEPDTIEYMREECGSGDIIHAGTYFGDFLPALSSACADGAIVWAFEPNRENYRCARITMEINEANNVRLMNAGLGEKHQYLRVETTDSGGRSLGGGSRIVSGRNMDERGTEPVEIVAIDDVVGDDRTVAILQLDVEGHEKQALAGAIRTIRRCKPIIILEVLPGSDLLESEWFSTNILNVGYREHAQLHGNKVFIS